MSLTLPATIHCNKCAKILPLDSFYVGNRFCKECFRRRQKEHHLKEISQMPERFCECGCGNLLSDPTRHFIHGHNARGLNHYNWKGYTIGSNGYILIKKPGHPRADCNDYVYEHRLVYEETEIVKDDSMVKGKCCLLSWIDIHHKDRDKQNNIFSNLQPMILNPEDIWSKVSKLWE